jgi:DNA alkylation repair enzyme
MLSGAAVPGERVHLLAERSRRRVAHQLPNLYRFKGRIASNRRGRMVAPRNGNGSDDIGESLRALLRAGLELGVAEAARRLVQLAPPDVDRGEALEVDRILDAKRVKELVESVRADPTGLLQLVKEVWSRGGSKERRAAAHALGHGLSRLAPHRSLGLVRELAAMATSPKEAELVGEEAIAPMLESNPSFFDRVKQFLQENQPWIRRAAIVGLVAYVARRRRFTAAALEAVLLLADRHEADIRAAVKQAVKDLSAIDWKATARAIAEWAKADPTGGRAKLARQYAGSMAADARHELQRLLFSNLAKFATAAPARGR